MKKILPHLLLVISVHLNSQDTFSIVAVDSTTGEVGSAGCSCLEAPHPALGALIISDIIPGKGAMHTQALWEAYNQQTGHVYMSSGFMPEEIIHEVNISDIANDSTIRQYGVALFDANGHPRAAGYTGANCYDYKGHTTGAYYSIQGNIITDHALLDSMETRFLNTQGTLADKLMACLQGANIPGADTRCLAEGVPGKSAFLRVAKPTDVDTVLHLHLNVKSRPYGISPIDSLQTLYTKWKIDHQTGINSIQDDGISIWPNPASSVLHIQSGSQEKTQVTITDMLGNLIEQKAFANACTISLTGYPGGIYFVRIGEAVRRLVVR